MQSTRSRRQSLNRKETHDLENYYEQNLDPKREYDYIVHPSKKVATFQCCKVDLHFETPNLEMSNPGFYIRLEPLSDKASAAPIRVVKALKQQAF